MSFIQTIGRRKRLAWRILTGSLTIGGSLRFCHYRNPADSKFSDKGLARAEIRDRVASSKSFVWIVVTETCRPVFNI